MKSKNNFPKVLIGLLNWNEISYTLGCIKSLEKMDYKNYEILVLDNGSKEDSVIKLKKLEEEGRISLILKKKNFGFTGGNNRIIEYSLKNKKFDYLLLLNNDTLVEKDFLRKQINFMEKTPNAGVVGPIIFRNKKEINWDNSPGVFNLVIGGARLYPNWKNLINNLESPIKVDYVSGCSWLIKKEVLEKTKGFKEKYFIYNEEIEWAYRINKLGYSFYLHPKSKIYHIGHGSVKKFSGFQLYYNIRNIIWFEREYARKKEYIQFFIFLFLYKFPKTLIRILMEKEDSGKKIKKYLSGIWEGLSEKRESFILRR